MSAKIVLVAAVAENSVIGADGEIPWHYPEDLQHFKETTMGSPVVMGRRTYESIERDLGGPLPGRTNVVLSRQESLSLPEGAVHAQDAEEALEKAAEALEVDDEETAGTNDGTIYVAGGQAVYEQFLDRADELVVTEIPESPDGDSYFPEIGPEWEEVEREEEGELSFVRYRRRS